MTELIESPHKPFDQFTNEDKRIFDSPSVEDHIRKISKALALAAVVSWAKTTKARQEIGLSDAMLEDSEILLAESFEGAWESARMLQDLLPAEIQSLSVVADAPTGVGAPESNGKGPFLWKAREEREAETAAQDDDATREGT